MKKIKINKDIFVIGFLFITGTFFIINNSFFSSVSIYAEYSCFQNGSCLVYLDDYSTGLKTYKTPCVLQNGQSIYVAQKSENKITGKDILFLSVGFFIYGILTNLIVVKYLKK